MLEFIPIGNKEELVKQQIDLKDIGKSSGLFGRKVYLIYDQTQGWGVTRLNFFQRMARSLFFWYGETHSTTVKKHLADSRVNSSLPPEVVKHIKDIWNWNIQIQQNSHVKKQNKPQAQMQPQLTEKNATKKNAGPLPFAPRPSDEAHFSNRSGQLDQKIKQLVSDSVPDNSDAIKELNLPGVNNAVDLSHYLDKNMQLSDDNPYKLSEEELAIYYSLLAVQDGRNIQRVAHFGNVEEMGYNENEDTAQLIQKIAVEHSELRNYLYLNVRGNGSCGYRTMVTGLIYHDCILNERINHLSQSIGSACENLGPSWIQLFPEEQLLIENHQRCRELLEKLKTETIEQRLAKLQEEEFLAPFISLVRCLIVSEIKFIESQHINAQDEILAGQIRGCVKIFVDNKTIKYEYEEELLTYALSNYSLHQLNAEILPDIKGNDVQNLLKEDMKEIIKKASNKDLSTFNKLIHLIKQKSEVTNQANVLKAPEAESKQEGISLDAFLREKVLTDSDKLPEYLWAMGSDFTALGYALDKNICCIYKDKYKDNAYEIQRTFPDRPVDFYGLNLSESHYNPLIPLPPKPKQ